MGLWMEVVQFLAVTGPPSQPALPSSHLWLVPLQSEVRLWSTVARLSAAVNVLLLVGLGYVWARNYLQFRSKHTLGLVVFSVLLLAKNGCALYYYLADPTMSAWFTTAVPGIAWRAMMLLHVLETVALLFLVWVTWD